MALYIDEVMNHELFNAEPEQPADELLGHLLLLEITGAPVLDDDGRCVGMVSMRDLVKAKAGVAAAGCMSPQVATVRKRTSLQDAGRLMAEQGRHRVVVVDDQDVAVGVASALDVLRGLLGVPSMHPAAFPHYDIQTGLNWTDDFALTVENANRAPDRPGVLVLLHGGANRPERLVLAESAQDLRARLVNLAAHPEGRPIPACTLRGCSGQGCTLAFRAAPEPDPARRVAVVDRLLEHPWRRVAPADDAAGF